jgi:putative tryptophan/tyrosine transport system substrate-binding protein
VIKEEHRQPELFSPEASAKPLSCGSRPALPAIYEFDFFVRDGGLMSYGADFKESFERAASLIDRIFKGAKPADLPFEEPTRYVFVVNLKTAKSIGLELPPNLLALADEVIETKRA